jgi:hypothetical protein
MSRAAQQMGPLLLLAGMLLPIWVGPHPPLYDYPNHLLEAHILAHYEAPQFAYWEGYEIRPGWEWRSNALASIVLAALMLVLPSLLAGQVFLSGCVALFVGGWWLLLRRQQAAWPLLLLAPVLAFNYTWSSGFLNFALSITLGLYALLAYLRWQAGGHWLNLLALALLLFLIYMAHLFGWVLVLVSLAVLAAAELLPLRRAALLWLAMGSALPALLATRPMLALPAALIGPLAWAGAALVWRLRERPLLLTGGALLAGGAAYVGYRLTSGMLAEVVAGLDFRWSYKAGFLLRTFAVPHPVQPPSPLLGAANLALLALLVGLVGLLLASAWSSIPDTVQRRRWALLSGVLGLLVGLFLLLPYSLGRWLVIPLLAALLVLAIWALLERRPWLVALAGLGLLYLGLPSHTADIQITEPRTLLLLALIGFAAAPLPAAGLRRRAIVTLALLLGVLGVGSHTYAAVLHNQQAREWEQQLATLAPARRVLVFYGHGSDDDRGFTRQLLYSSRYNTFYNGFHFNNLYTLTYGGFNTSTFNNGPVRPWPGTEMPRYWPAVFDDTAYVQGSCETLRATYDAVLVWPRPDPTLDAALDACFTQHLEASDLSTWRGPSLSSTP